MRNLIASKYNPEKTIINEEHTLEQSHVVQNTSIEEPKVKFNVDLNDKPKDETEQTFNDYTMAEYSVIGGVKKKKKKKVKRKANDSSQIKTNADTSASEKDKLFNQILSSAVEHTTVELKSVEDIKSTRRT